MKAVVIEGPEAVAWVELERPTPGPGEVLVRSHAAGICRTDLEIVHGDFSDPRWIRFPLVPGHEWSGSVAELGEGLTDLAVGDRVVCDGILACHRCRACRRGDAHLCENLEQIGFTRPGGYAELVVAPAESVHRLPDDASFAAGALVEPAACVLHGLERGGPRPGESVGVVGVGTLGSLALRLLRLHSPGALVAYGLRAEELELAKAMGADATVNVAEQDADAATRRAAGDGLDLVLETAGAAAAVELATRLVRRGGRVVLIGIAGAGKTLELPADRIVFGDLTVQGCLAYTRSAWSRVLRLLEEGLVDLEQIVTHRFPAERFDEAFAVLDERRGQVGKVLLEHSVGGAS